jgi:hypothetical protein
VVGKLTHSFNKEISGGNGSRRCEPKWRGKWASGVTGGEVTFEDNEGVKIFELVSLDNNMVSFKETVGFMER